MRSSLQISFEKTISYLCGDITCQNKRNAHVVSQCSSALQHLNCCSTQKKMKVDWLLFGVWYHHLWDHIFGDMFHQMHSFEITPSKWISDFLSNHFQLKEVKWSLYEVWWLLFQAQLWTSIEFWRFNEKVIEHYRNRFIWGQPLCRFTPPKSPSPQGPVICPHPSSWRDE